MLARNHIKQSEHRISASLSSTLNFAFIFVLALLIALLLGIAVKPAW
jgi:hypothetical protein